MTKKKAKSRAAKKAAAKKVAAPDNSLLQAKGSEARKRALADEAAGGNILGSEPLGPAAEHEDHEGGDTDSLTKKGVRAPVDKPETADDQIVRAPSIRERQTHRGAQGGQRPDAVTALKSLDKGKKAKVVRVVSEAEGFYGNRRRHRGDVFDYTLGPDEEKLPSWMTAADGSMESRRKGEVSTADLVSTIIEVSPTGDTTVSKKARK